MLNIKNTYQSGIDYLKKIISAFGLTEKTIFIILSIALLISGLSLLGKLNSYLTKIMPAHGGSLTEGVVGSPRFINPLLELSDADRDLTYLVYSGLMRATASGDLIPDLAESYNISPDGLTYTFKIRDDAYFHDGQKVTADDIEYTITMAQNANLRSPKKNSWVGVTVEKVSPSEITFNLKQPYSPFLENTTLGILPKHIWESATTDEFTFSPYNNINPVGSGPYKISNIKKNSMGIPVRYELKAFADYSLGEPFITTLNFNFYQNEKELADAYLSGEIDSESSLSPQNFDLIKNKTSAVPEKISLPRIFGLFFNQNQNKIFLNKEVRQALNMTVDKDRIVREVLGGYGEAVNSPLPNEVLGVAISTTTYNRETAIAAAKEVLTKAGWKFNETSNLWEKKISKTEIQKLTFSISTSNVPDLKNTADILKEDWALLGVPVEVQTFEPNDLNQSVIAPRKYDSLLFGEIINRSLDLFAFWHSSQRNIGNNLAMYTNSKADKLLEDARQITGKEERLEKYTLFEKEILNDIPAIFIYSPEFIYVLPQKILGFESGLINNRSERFEEIYRWYIETDKIWKFLAK